MKIIFSGGGTLGSVTPLLAIKDAVAQHLPGVSFVWVGTKQGPERQLIEGVGIPFHTLSSGKFRRYISVWNVIDILRVFVGFFQSLIILLQEKPTVCISAGGFISVPLHWAAWVLGIPTWIHQQDVRVGLANRLMAPCARVITTALEMSVKYFSQKKTIWLGNPVRADIIAGTQEHATKVFGLQPGLPVVFATGGGTGSMRVNQMITEAVQQLDDVCQIIHLSGLERPQELVERTSGLFPYYHAYQFFSDEMKDAYAAADVVVSRGGFGTMAEIAALGKPAIIIPKQGHQEENAKFLANEGAVITVSEITSDGLFLANKIKELLGDDVKRKELSETIRKILPVSDDKKIIDILMTLQK